MKNSETSIRKSNGGGANRTNGDHYDKGNIPKEPNGGSISKSTPGESVPPNGDKYDKRNIPPDSA